jgi:uncharacterized repeat protein (TIGR03803 family)
MKTIKSYAGFPKSKGFRCSLWAACALAAVSIAQGGTEAVLHSFAVPLSGGNPESGLIQDSAGNLYGTASAGGPAGAGVVFKISPAGRETVLYSFTGGADGAKPLAGVILDAAGNLYGTTNRGGASGYGVVFELSPSGHETVLHSFTGGADGSAPYAGLIRDSAGNLYGTTFAGGASDFGVVFKVDPTGHQTVLYHFKGLTDGGLPSSGVILDSAGNLYGTTGGGGIAGCFYGCGVVYKLDTSGNETTLYSFTNGADGGDPESGLIRDAAGNLYGTTPGASSAATVYKLDTSGNLTVLYTFTGGADGGTPDSAGVVSDAAGNLYGTAAYGGAFGGGVVYKVDTTGIETVLYNFTGASDGAHPEAGVIRDAAGNFYGTTFSGGPSNEGAVFELNASGQETVLYGFLDGDGLSPVAGVIRDAAGNLYGTTLNGGPANAGVVYKVSETGLETVLYSFTGAADGGSPPAGLSRDTAGKLYGTTYAGGASGHGVVFKLNPAGRETVLHSFTGLSDGAYPRAGVILDAAGNLYGTTAIGGASNAGVVFKMSPTGRETVLYSFTGGADGGAPWAGVVRDLEGNLYGTTFYGGPLGGGVVYKLDTAGHETVLYSFNFFVIGFGQTAGVTIDTAGNVYGTDGVHATVFKINKAGTATVLATLTDVGFGTSGVVLDPAGNLYGTSNAGGSGYCYSSGGVGCGIVFKLDTSGNETVLYSFTGGTDGGNPDAGVILDAAGNLYGTGQVGGEGNGGVVFKVVP